MAIKIAQYNIKGPHINFAKKKFVEFLGKIGLLALNIILEEFFTAIFVFLTP